MAEGALLQNMAQAIIILGWIRMKSA